MHIFARLTKIDEATRTVEGIIASEMLDHSGEIFDYDRSKPNFMKWSEGIAKSTEGKSLGNVRVMHGKTVAGITKTLSFDDAGKCITVAAEIVDDNEWNKVKKGCYTGFSIGGKYVGDKWDDPVHKGAKRYEADPNEYSLVDLPCNPSARFTVIKADGSEELCKFENTTAPDSLAKWVETLDDSEQDTITDALLRSAERKAEATNESTTGDLSKSATSPEEIAMNEELQKNHDLAKAELATAQADLTKAVGERDDLQKALDAAATEIATRDELLVKAAAALDERNDIIQKFKDAPAPVKAALMAIAKGDDLVTEVKEADKVKKADGTVDEAATAIKKALMNPVVTR